MTKTTKNQIKKFSAVNSSKFEQEEDFLVRSTCDECGEEHRYQYVGEDDFECEGCYEELGYYPDITNHTAHENVKCSYCNSPFDMWESANRYGSLYVCDSCFDEHVPDKSGEYSIGFFDGKNMPVLLATGVVDLDDIDHILEMKAYSASTREYLKSFDINHLFLIENDKICEENEDIVDAFNRTFFNFKNEEYANLSLEEKVEFVEDLFSNSAFNSFINSNIIVNEQVFDSIKILKEKLYWFDHFALSDEELLAISKILPEVVKPDGLTQLENASKTFDILVETIYLAAIRWFLV